jgi:L-ascorbate metabolism protein UlaG (beta-lactamase superfamily)
VHLTLVRHATLLLAYAGRRLMVDPMLDPAGARGPVRGSGRLEAADVATRVHVPADGETLSS